MDIDIPDAAPEKRAAINQVEHFFVRRDGCLGQLPLRVQNEITLPEIAERELANHERMSENRSTFEQTLDCSITEPQMVYPDRCI
jgi:hypothetical protein